jgi:class 3 adenylate cyclase
VAQDRGDDGQTVRVDAVTAAAARGPVDVTVELPDGRTVAAQLPLVLGRAHAQAVSHPDVDLAGVDPHRQVSRRHARVESAGGRILVTDLGSTNGTWVDERPLPPGGSAAFAPDVRIRLGDVEVRLRARPVPAPGWSRSFADTVTVSALDIAHLAAAAAPGARAGPAGTVSFLYTDIESSTALGERLGDIEAAAVWRTHDEIVRHHLRSHAGHEVSSQGDGFLLAFSSTRMALRCAIAIQRTLDARRRADQRTAIAVRMGVHCGDVVTEAGNYHGRHVVIAARIGAAASGGEILASWLVRELSSTGDVDFVAPRELTLKGLSGTFRVYTVPWAAGTGIEP